MFDNFPYTNFHEMNLDYILKEISRYDAIITSFQEWMVEAEADYAEIVARIDDLSSQMAGFKNEINAEFDALKAQQTAQLNAALVSFQNQFNQLMNDTQNQINQLRNDINSAIIQLDGRMDANNQNIRNYVEFRLDQFIQDFPSIYDLPVYNPVQGVVTNINTALKDLYDLNRAVGALTAGEYDSLGISAGDYDALGLTAFQYDTAARFLLGFPDVRYFMVDPFTGLYELIGKVVQKLANLHKNALTASAYDAKLLDATSYDALNLSAYDYDWNGATLIP